MDDINPPPRAGVAEERRIEEFIARWLEREGGQERANYALFLTELCIVLGLAPPDPASATTEENDYVFERLVTFKEFDRSTLQGRIDLYKRGCFVLEAKQSGQKGGYKEIAGQTDLFGEQPGPYRGRRGAVRSWDVLMMNARRQAEGYARALPVAHGWPPFILVCDVGHVIEFYADFSGQGKNYAQFPDRQSFRIFLEDLRRQQIRDRRSGGSAIGHSGRLRSRTPLPPPVPAAAADRMISPRAANLIQS